MKTMSRRGWRRQEPGYLGRPERPQMLTKAMEALASIGFAISDLVDFTHLDEATLTTIIGVGDEANIGVELGSDPHPH